MRAQFLPHPLKSLVKKSPALPSIEAEAGVLGRLSRKPELRKRPKRAERLGFNDARAAPRRFARHISRRSAVYDFFQHCGHVRFARELPGPRGDFDSTAIHKLFRLRREPPRIRRTHNRSAPEQPL